MAAALTVTVVAPLTTARVALWRAFAASVTVCGALDGLLAPALAWVPNSAAGVPAQPPTMLQPRAMVATVHRIRIHADCPTFAGLLKPLGVRPRSGYMTRREYDSQQRTARGGQHPYRTARPRHRQRQQARSHRCGRDGR